MCWSCQTVPGTPVHPHVCGEHDIAPGHSHPCLRFIPTCVGNIPQRLLVLADPGGSSPRVWGTSELRTGGKRYLRFIPTCVGNMALLSRSSAAVSVHPHVCGEHDDEGDHLISTSGSSPRVWGTYILPFFITGSPAVHPHVCGEHELCPKATLVPSRFIPTCVGNMNAERRGQHNADGSSPRVWGTLDRQRAERLPPRFIPTCVGNMCPKPPGVKR